MRDFQIGEKIIAFDSMASRVFYLKYIRDVKEFSLYVRFEIFTEVTKKNASFWDVTPCGFCKNRRFRGTYSCHHQDDKNRRARNNISSY
jgi:hypothetical protein